MYKESQLDKNIALLKRTAVILNFPKEFKIGRESVHMKCMYCNRSPQSLEDSLYVKEYGFCLGCEPNSDFYAQQAQADMEDLNAG